MQQARKKGKREKGKGQRGKFDRAILQNSLFAFRFSLFANFRPLTSTRPLAFGLWLLGVR
jgi:hypothetical protein